MNFLAHAYLSGDNPEIIVGNFIGDFVKGKNLTERYPPEIVRGIELHRAIDAFTDSHGIVHLSKDKLRPKYRHYSPVIIDMFYDHLLAYNWSVFHEDSLADFASGVYTILQQYTTFLPEKFKRMLPYLIRGNWLLNYANIEGIQQALSGMAQRTPYQSHMEEAVNELELHYEDFTKEFLIFFPQLKQHADLFLKS